MNILTTLVGVCPAFRQVLVVTAEQWLNEDGSISSCAVLSLLSGFVIGQLQQADYDDIAEIFSVIEEFLDKGPQELRDAAATCFLENLLNATPHEITPDFFVSLLGPLSKEHCRSWDKFTGVKTPGLW